MLRTPTYNSGNSSHRCNLRVASKKSCQKGTIRLSTRLLPSLSRYPPTSPCPHETNAQGVSSRVEGVSSRMSLRAKDMLALSAGEGNGASGNGSPVSHDGSPGGATSAGNGSARIFSSNSASGILIGIADDTPVAPTPADETEVRQTINFIQIVFLIALGMRVCVLSTQQQRGGCCVPLFIAAAAENSIHTPLSSTW